MTSNRSSDGALSKEINKTPTETAVDRTTTTDNTTPCNEPTPCVCSMPAEDPNKQPYKGLYLRDNNQMSTKESDDLSTDEGIPIHEMDIATRVSNINGQHNSVTRINDAITTSTTHCIPSDPPDKIEMSN